MTTQQNQAIQNALYAQQDQAQGLGQQPAVYVPKPGEVVVVVYSRTYDFLAGEVLRVICASSPDARGETRITCTWRGFPGIDVRTCRVRPLRSAIDVECPWCLVPSGEPCVDKNTGELYSLAYKHPQRAARLRELTGQAPKDSSSVGATIGAPNEARNVGSERGDSDTGRAAAGEAVSMEPAAAPFFPKCAGVPGFPDSCEQEAMGVSELCGDCQSWLNEPARDLSPLDARIREARDKLRADLDRPLPPAALRTWPEHWSNPGWES